MRRIPAVFMAAFLLSAAFLFGAWQTQQNFGTGLPVGLFYSPPTFTVSTVGAGNGVLALAGTTSGTATFTAPAVAGTATNPVLVSNSLQLATGTVLNWNADAGFSRESPGTLDAGNGTAGNVSAFVRTGNKVFVTTDFTDANSAALQAITGLSYTFGTTAQNWSFHCALMYSQATPVAGNQFGIGVLTTAPTQANATATVATNVTTTQFGSLNALASTTPTAVVTFTTVPTSVLTAYVDGTIELAGAGAATFNIYVLNGTAADVIVIKRGSYCAIY